MTCVLPIGPSMIGPFAIERSQCYILPMFFLNLFFKGRLILRPWLTEVRESFTRRGGP